ncbi:MAG: FecR family protein, partial [Rhodovibrionaceae bacterium]|nr:FecR family protein [Rhodovibrionaceae bacterium]
MKRVFQTLCLSFTVAVIAASTAQARECEPAAGRLVSVEGLVEIESGAGWKSADVDASLCEEDTVRTGRNSRAAISLLNDAVLRLDQNTTVRLVDITPEPEERSFLDMIAGAIQSFSRDPRRLEVDTPYLNATVEGTEFALLVTDDRSELTVLEGQVRASNDEGAVSATSGQIAEAPAGMPPTIRLIARPRDAVQWALYYPPILAVDAAATPQEAEAAKLAKAGRPDQALDTL